jgi:hypothetical protein
MVFNSQRLSKRRSGGFPAAKKSQHNKHFGPFMCRYKQETNRCVQSGDGHDSEHCYLNENNNCALKSTRSTSSSRANPWLEHVNQFRNDHPELSYKDALKEASKTYVRDEDRSQNHLMNGGFNVHVTTNTGKKMTLDMNSYDTFKMLKTKIATQMGLPDYNYIRLGLGLGARELDDDRTLADIGIFGETTIKNVGLRLPPSSV